MKYIVLKSESAKPIRFKLFKKEAPKTCRAFSKSLPLKRKMIHAKVDDKEEIWTPNGPRLKIKQENASIRLKPGEMGYAPFVERSEISNCIAIVYGKAILWDCVNVFAKVVDEDLENLKKLGRKIKRRPEVLEFELM